MSDPTPAYLRAPGIVIDDVDELDKDNMGWVKSYLGGITERIAREEAAEARDEIMIGYLKGEQATYQALMDRVAPPR